MSSPKRISFADRYKFLLGDGQEEEDKNNTVVSGDCDNEIKIEINKELNNEYNSPTNDTLYKVITPDSNMGENLDEINEDDGYETEAMEDENIQAQIKQYQTDIKAIKKKRKRRHSSTGPAKKKQKTIHEGK